MNAREWIRGLAAQGSERMETFGFWPLLFVMLVSLLSSLFLAALYLGAYRNRPTGSSIYRAFPLLGPAITGVFICIQFSLPLSLGLLGALSIVRFRTPIKEPEEIGFLMVVIAAALSCATFSFQFLGIILLVAVLGLLALNARWSVLNKARRDGMVIVSLPRAQYDQSKERVLRGLEEGLPRGHIDSIVEQDAQAVIHYSFLGGGREGIALFDRLKQDVPGLQVNVFFSHGGEI
jgi:hypothetical protein